jgi:protoporphyrinogen oxidase
LPTPQRGDFESWVTGRFGVRLYQIFFKTYSEKLWGINCSELDADFAAQRIKKLSLFEAVKNALCKDHAPRHKTLVDRFAYPLEGTGMVYRRMQSAIEANGGRILLHAPVKGVVTRNGTVAGITLHDDRFHACDEVVSTMPLTLMVQSLPEAPGPVRALAETLRFRNTIIVFLHVRGAGYFSDQWIYVHTNRLRTGRITNFRNWIPELHGDSPNTVLALEYWCNPGDALWSDDDQALLELATREIRATGLLGRSDVLGGHVCRIPRCYPVYDRGYRERLRPVQEYLATVRHLHAIGRYGAFKYNNQDHSILMGLLAAENILQGAGHDLWEINTDYETYQEMALISDTGLVECGQPAGKGA